MRGGPLVQGHCAAGAVRMPASCRAGGAAHATGGPLEEDLDAVLGKGREDTRLLGDRVVGSGVLGGPGEQRPGRYREQKAAFGVGGGGQCSHLSRLFFLLCVTSTDREGPRRLG